MSWRVVCKYKYNDLYFDFETLEEAGEFVKTMLTHYKGDDNEDQGSISLRIIPNKEEEENE